MGRQPWVVYPSVSGPDGVSLLTESGVSQSVSGIEVLITLVLFTLVYLFIFIAWIRIIKGFIVKGPEADASTDGSADCASEVSTDVSTSVSGAAKGGSERSGAAVSEVAADLGLLPSDPHLAGSRFSRSQPALAGSAKGGE